MTLRFPPGWSGAEILFLDCDSTLSTIEGIDELARRREIDVSGLTAAAMAGELPVESVYAERLRQIRPDAADLEWLAGRYRETVVEGAAGLVAAAHAMGIACHVISGGLLPAVQPFAEGLGVPALRVHAVPFPVDAPDPVEVASAHPLARNGGKPLVIASVCANGPPRECRMLVGDGMSDLEAAPEVGLFVAFSGVVDRPSVRAASPVVLRAARLDAFAALVAGPDRLAELERHDPKLHDRALRDLSSPDPKVFQCP